MTGADPFTLLPTGGAEPRPDPRLDRRSRDADLGAGAFSLHLDASARELGRPAAERGSSTGRSAPGTPALDDRGSREDAARARHGSSVEEGSSVENDSALEDGSSLDDAQPPAEEVTAGPTGRRVGRREGAQTAGTTGGERGPVGSTAENAVAHPGGEVASTTAGGAGRSGGLTPAAQATVSDDASGAQGARMPPARRAEAPGTGDGSTEPAVRAQAPQARQAADAADAFARRTLAAALHAAVSGHRGDAPIEGEMAATPPDEAATRMRDAKAVEHALRASGRAGASAGPVPGTLEADLASQLGQESASPDGASTGSGRQGSGLLGSDALGRAFERALVRASGGRAQATLAPPPAPVTGAAAAPLGSLDALGSTGSLAAPGSTSAATSTADAELPQQIIRAIRLQWSQGVSEARLRLQPQHLGEVHVSLRVEQGVVRADLQADSAEVRSWIRAHEADLKRGLAEHGLYLGRLSVTEDERRDDQHRHGNDGSGRRRAPRRHVDAPFEVPA